LNYDEKVFNLEVGDTIYFDASIPHLGESIADEDLVLLMITVNPGNNQIA
jgi:mannose-6-phosphate isomerase-like protein (cupin superfamily)